ncbi:hypothetical protein [Cupriavidus pauculus]|uniref:hypothetical protein n=1 Tax=Cupriavidus pauculus TaxID=82633 RepID=UPI0007850648|nr:hypothetical protein [Cupriavidus pauculus]KAB0602203.1 hypothetical protein F7R19_14025 [Cupriavidus pauculus]MBY4732992.1 hypothetical protein [Cupriavidus pauculus]MCM3605524.1 hypothetical protein [Cupriavidus pauculus]UAL02482.1 hypothetical protein K8O84_27430 [Cupriavidus pauculus]
MPDFRLPLSGDVSQSINPWTWFVHAVGNQFGVVNINLGRSTNPDMEARILDEVGSYGNQLGKIGDALGVLLAHVDRSKLSESESCKISEFEAQLAEIARVKAKRAAIATRP